MPVTDMSNTKKLSNGRKTVNIIVPCYNEENNIDAFFDRVQSVIAGDDGISQNRKDILSEDIDLKKFGAEKCTDNVSDKPNRNVYNFTYYFIDDGSTDGTLEKVRALAKKHDFVHYISFSRNFGKEAAMYAGLKAAKESNADYAVIIDADLQHPPELIGEMISTIEKTGCDSCAARRVNRKGEPMIRSIFARAFYRIMNRFSDIEIIDGAVDFRMMNRQMIKAIVDMPETQRFSKGIFAWVGFDTRWIEFENIERISGESKWSVWSLTKYAIAGFIDFAASPLKAIGVFGGITSAGSLLYLIIEILKTLIVGKDVPGYASIICLILFFGGLVIAVLSIMGEYIGRMYMETKNRPIYIEKESSLDE